MRRLILLALTLIPFPVQRARVYEGRIDDTYLLRVEASHLMKSPNECCTTLLRVLLVDRSNANRYWEIAAIREEFDQTYAVKRADTSSVVIERTDPDYGIYHGSMKLFFDVRSKRLLKRIDFDSTEALKSVTDDEARRVGVDPEAFRQIQDTAGQEPNLDNPDLPPQLQNETLPQSTYQQFARERPDQVRHGYDEKSVRIEEKIGAYQVVDGRIWFGETFYDGEGHSGIGGLGFFDIAGRSFTFLKIPEIVGLSVSALLFESQTLWAGLESFGEGASGPGGLLRHDLRTSITTIYHIEDPIRAIHRSGNAIVVGTTNGIYVLSGSRLVRHRPEPTMDGKMALYSENL